MITIAPEKYAIYLEYCLSALLHIFLPPLFSHLCLFEEALWIERLDSIVYSSITMTMKFVLTTVSLLLGLTTAEKDSGYWPSGTQNPNVKRSHYWREAHNVLQDIDQFSKLYVAFHNCAWVYQNIKEWMADNLALGPSFFPWSCLTWSDLFVHFIFSLDCFVFSSDGQNSAMAKMIRMKMDAEPREAMIGIGT